MHRLWLSICFNLNFNHDKCWKQILNIKTLLKGSYPYVNFFFSFYNIANQGCHNWSFCKSSSCNCYGFLQCLTEDLHLDCDEISLNKLCAKKYKYSSLLLKFALWRKPKSANSTGSANSRNHDHIFFLQNFNMLNAHYIMKRYKIS